MKLLILKHESEYILGLGDVIDCLSLIVQVAKSNPNDIILFPCFGKYEANIKSMLPRGINVKLEPIRDIANHIPELIAHYNTIRFENSDKYIYDNKLTGHTDINGLYHLAGLDYYKRDEYCPISQRQWSYNGYQDMGSPNIAFIPEGGSPQLNGFEGYKINRKHVKQGLVAIVPPQSAMLLQWVDVIKEAAEIHCHVTSWWRLIDRLPTNGKLFMHHYARETRIKPNEFEFRKPWIQLL